MKQGEKKLVNCNLPHNDVSICPHIRVYEFFKYGDFFFTFVLYHLLLYEIRLRERWTFASQALWCGHHPMDGHNHITQ